MITDRDIQIINFLKEVNVADTKTIAILFFNGGIRRAQQRLKILCDNNHIKVFRDTSITQNVFYVGRKPKNWKHKIVFSQLLAQLKLNNITILKYRTPFKIDQVIADGFIAININGKNKIYLVEVERTKSFNTNKYLELYYSRKWKELFPVFPSILVITDKTIKTHNRLDIKQCKLNMNDLTIN